MKPDPKFGWHVLWITPLAVLILAYASYAQLFGRVKSEKRKRTWTKEQRELQVLAGIRDKEGNLK